jgi:hypothetical protein
VGFGSDRGLWRARAIALATVVVLGIVAPGCKLRDDELSCEEAAKHLADCCPGIDVQALNCTFASNVDGQGVDSYPDFSVPESQCIDGESCDTLQGSGVCDRAFDLAMADYDNAEHNLPVNINAYNPSPVCP